jgi:hypothetical protein
MSDPSRHLRQTDLSPQWVVIGVEIGTHATAPTTTVVACTFLEAPPFVDIYPSRPESSLRRSQ